MIQSFIDVIDSISSATVPTDFNPDQSNTDKTTVGILQILGNVLTLDFKLLNQNLQQYIFGWLNDDYIIPVSEKEKTAIQLGSSDSSVHGNNFAIEISRSNSTSNSIMVKHT